MSKALQRLREGLFSTGMVQPVESTGRGGSVSVLCRQLPNQERPWLQIVDALLKVSEEAGIDLHVCRRYLRKAGQMVFGWHIGVTAQNAKSLVDAVEKLLPTFSSIQPLSAAPVRRAAPPPTEPEDLLDEEVAKPQTEGQRRAAENVAKSTTAHPRAPEFSGPDPVPPPNFVPKVRVIRNEVDDTGQRHIVTEMPLPHTYQELNKPKPGSTKGAKYTAG